MITKKHFLNIVGTNKYNKESKEELIEQIDAKLRKRARDLNLGTAEPWGKVVLYTELPMKTRDCIARQYKNAGWHRVIHTTNAQLHKKPSRTYFYFFSTLEEFKSWKASLHKQGEEYIVEAYHVF